MGLECELKYLDVDHEVLRRSLVKEGAQSDGPYFESNVVFDFSDRSLKEKGVLLRLREKMGKAVLTVKHPPEKTVSSLLKVFEELETEVGNAMTLRAMLKALGLNVVFSYEKVREKWALDGCVVCLDRLPFGCFVEIEGSEESVPLCAQRLGIEDADTTLLTYHALNIEYRSGRKMSYDESFVFADRDRGDILRWLKKE